MTSFVYEFDLPDAGTYWYHPHQNSAEQVGRGLSGALIVEEREPIRVDRDVVWLLSDWRLLPDAQISDDFRNMHDMAHNGRVGNTVTMNGRVRETFAVRSGERIRLAAHQWRERAHLWPHLRRPPAEGHRPRRSAGRAARTRPTGVSSSARRCASTSSWTWPAKPGERFQVIDNFYRGLEYRLLDLVYGRRSSCATKLLDTPIALPPNTMPEPDMNSAERHEITFNGGMMGQMMMRDRGMAGMNMMEMMHTGKIWFINGVAMTGARDGPDAHAEARPLLCPGHEQRNGVVAPDASARPCLPGHQPQRRADPISRMAGHRAHGSRAKKSKSPSSPTIPGDWMFHCHILEHQESGMMGVIRVA